MSTVSVAVERSTETRLQMAEYPIGHGASLAVIRAAHTTLHRRHTLVYFGPLEQPTDSAEAWEQHESHVRSHFPCLKSGGKHTRAKRKHWGDSDTPGGKKKHKSGSCGGALTLMNDEEKSLVQSDESVRLSQASSDDELFAGSSRQLAWSPDITKAVLAVASDPTREQENVWTPQIIEKVSMTLDEGGMYPPGATEASSEFPYLMAIVGVTSDARQTWKCMPLVTKDHLQSTLNVWEPIPASVIVSKDRLWCEWMCAVWNEVVEHHVVCRTSVGSAYSRGNISVPSLYVLQCLFLHMATDPTVIYSHTCLLHVLLVAVYLLGKVENEESESVLCDSRLSVDIARQIHEDVPSDSRARAVTQLGSINVAYYLMKKFGWALSLVRNPLERLLSDPQFINDLCVSLEAPKGSSSLHGIVRLAVSTWRKLPTQNGTGCMEGHRRDCMIVFMDLVVRPALFGNRDYSDPALEKHFPSYHPHWTHMVLMCTRSASHDACYCYMQKKILSYASQQLWDDLACICSDRRSCELIRYYNEQMFSDASSEMLYPPDGCMCQYGVTHAK